MMETIRTVEDVFKAMSDSVGAIDMVIADGKKDCKRYEKLIANYTWLEAELVRDYIKNDGRTLKSYEDAIVNAKAYMGMDV